MAGQFSAHIWTSIWAGVILAFPYVLYEVWKFISPALYENERKLARGFILIASLLFFIGVLFGYYLITPLSVNFLGSYSVSPEVRNQIDLNSYISVVRSSVISCGIIFELPIVVYFLTKLGVITPAFIRNKYFYFSLRFKKRTKQGNLIFLMDCNTYLQHLPNVKTLKQLCKGEAVLDWIICGHEFEVYHTYYKVNEEEYEGYEAQWGHGFEDEDGSSLSFYFIDKACLIVPSSSAEDSKGGDNHDFEKRIPKVFLPYYRKNFSESDIPFVIYSLDGETWQCVENFPVEEHIDKFEYISTDPMKYKEWAVEYLGDEGFLQEVMSEQTITDLYEGKVLTEEMVYSIVTEVHDWVDLETELNEMPYRFSF